MDGPLLGSPELGHDHHSNTARARWRKLRVVEDFLYRLDSKEFMAAHGRVMTSTSLTRQLSRRVSQTFAESVLNSGALFAPPDRPDHELERPKTDVGASQDMLQTNGEAIVNLLNNCLGSGMLSMGFAFAKAGILASVGVMLLSAFLNRFTLLLNVKTNALAGTDPSSADVGHKAFGQAGRVSLILLYTIFSFFCCVSYVDASADAVSGLAALVAGGRMPSLRTTLIGCWAVLLLPTTLLRSLKAVALLSFVAFLGGLFMLAAVFSYCLSELAHTGLPALSSLAWIPPSALDFISAFPILLLVFSVQAGGGVVLATMRDTSAENVQAVSRNAYALVMAMDFLIGIMAYVTFTDRVQGNVLLNFSPQSWTAVVARVALLDLVVLSYMVRRSSVAVTGCMRARMSVVVRSPCPSTFCHPPSLHSQIMMVPCKLAMIDLAFGKNEARLEASPAQFYGVTLALNLAALVVALLISDLSLVLSLNGAVCTNIVAFVLPIAFYLRIRSSHEGAPLLSGDHAPYMLIIAFGSVSLVLGTIPIIGKLVGGSG